MLDVRNFDSEIYMVKKCVSMGACQRGAKFFCGAFPKAASKLLERILPRN